MRDQLSEGRTVWALTYEVSNILSILNTLHVGAPYIISMLDSSFQSLWSYTQCPPGHAILQDRSKLATPPYACCLKLRTG